MGSGSSKSSEESDEIVVSAGTVDCLKDGEMKEVEIEGSSKALLVKDKGQFYAVGSKCTHYGAPLAKGSYCEGRIRCPWHGACFNVSNGDIEEFPGLDSLHKYEVETVDNDVKIRVRRSQLLDFRRKQKTGGEEPSSNDRVLIIGGGPASVTCAETLRQNGFLGVITICSKELYLPYDRIKLSKNLNLSPAEAALRSASFYKSNNIGVKLKREAVAVNCQERVVKFSDGSTETYTKLVLATGSTPTRPPQCAEKHCLVLRDPLDAHKILSRTTGNDVIVVGASFIGMEVAAALKDKAKSVTVLGRQRTPFHRFLGEKVGELVLQMCEKRGLSFHGCDEIDTLVTKGDKLVAVKLKSGKELPAGLIVAGTGVQPNTTFLKDTVIELNDRGFIKVDKCMRTNVADVLAAGDITEFPLYLAGNKPCNIQHWSFAMMQGRIAALSILDNCEGIHSVPYFWSIVFGKSIRYCGYGPSFDEVIMHGNAEEEKFAAFYIKSDKVVAVASLGMDPLVSEFADLFRTGKHVSKAKIKDDPQGWKSGP